MRASAPALFGASIFDNAAAAESTTIGISATEDNAKFGGPQRASASLPAATT